MSKNRRKISEDPALPVRAGQGARGRREAIPRFKDPSKEIARIIAQAAFDTKANDLVVLDLKKLSAFADYFVIASGTSDRQVQAICNRIEEALKKNGIRALGIEGYQKGHWVLIDCGSVVAHVFYEETRGFYGLDKFWGDAAKVRFALK